MLQQRQQELVRGRRLGTLGLGWWRSAIAAAATRGRRRKPFQGAAGTLAAGSLWSGIFGSVYVPTRAAVDTTASNLATHVAVAEE